MTNSSATNSSALRPAWTPLTIGLMILGFIVWWPLGLAMIGYIIWGERFQGEIDSAQRSFKDAARSSGWGDAKPFSRSSQRRPTHNSAFNDYRVQEIERIEKERKRLDDDVREFEDYLANLRQARDKEEFDHFMHERSQKQNKGAPEIIET